MPDAAERLERALRVAAEFFAEFAPSRFGRVLAQFDRAAFAVTDEALVEAYEATGGKGPDADLLWREIRQRGLAA